MSEKLTVLTWLSKADRKNGADRADTANGATSQDLLAELRIFVKSNVAVNIVLQLTGLIIAVFSF